MQSRTKRKQSLLRSVQKKRSHSSIRKEVQSLQIVAPLLSNDSLGNPYEVLQQKEEDLARVRKEVKSLQMVVPLLSDELPSHELNRKPASSEQETMDRSNDSEATGTDDLVSLDEASPRPRFWEILKRKA